MRQIFPKKTSKDLFCTEVFRKQICWCFTAMCTFGFNFLWNNYSELLNSSYFSKLIWSMYFWQQFNFFLLQQKVFLWWEWFLTKNTSKIWGFILTKVLRQKATANQFLALHILWRDLHMFKQIAELWVEKIKIKWFDNMALISWKVALIVNKMP